MVRIPAKKRFLALILSSLLVPTLTYANTPLEEYVDMTILEESKSAATVNSESPDAVEDSTQEIISPINALSINELLKMDHFTRHNELIKSLDSIKQGAEENNPTDLLLLGYYYYSEAEDNREDTDFIKAKDYFIQAEALGSKEASYLIGDLYYYGEGVTQDYSQAANYYEKAGNQADALFSLGSLYMSGSGVMEDAQKGLALYTQAADLNNATAQYTLGYIFESGDYDSIKSNMDTATKWYTKACENSDTRSCDAAKRISIHTLSFPSVLAEIKTTYLPENENSSAVIPALDNLLNLDDFDQFNLLNENISALIKGTEANNPDATYLLGLFHQLKGDDYYDEYAYSQAKKIYDQALELGSRDALFSLGELYYYGNGVTQDYQKSFEYYSNPKLEDHPEAQFSIGVQYDLGEGVDQSYEKSFAYFQKASALNHNPSTFNVGYMYENGEFVEKDLDEAQKWYQLSCDNQYEEGCIAVSSLTSVDAVAAAETTQNNYQLQNIFNEIMGDSEGAIALELTPSSILTAEPYDARYFLNQSSDQLLENIKNTDESDAGDSLFLMAYLFYLEALENDDNTLYQQSHALLEKAELAGSSDAVFYLGKFSYEGLGVDQDYVKSKEYLERLSDSSNANALFYLASIYDEGLETPKDQAQSFNLYHKAANLGHADSTYNIAFMYEYGEYVEKDLVEAQSWYEKACTLGDEQGCRQAEILSLQNDNDEASVEENRNEVEGKMSSFFDEILNIFAP